ncbi:hypothetical protein LguiB_015263 [Lonicera macranthoides]
MGSNVEEEEEEDEPLSPYARAFQTKRLNCSVVATIGIKTTIDIDTFKLGLETTLIKHPRFSSLLVSDKNGRGLKWRRTKVDVENHVINPNVDPYMDSPDQFVEDYLTSLTKTPLKSNKPLWEFHILNLQTSNASSLAILKVHHSLGDGMSLISLLLACSCKTSDPDSVPAIPKKKQRSTSRRSSGFSGYMRWLLVTLWWLVVMTMNTLVGMVLFIATAFFLKDDESPIKGREGVEFSTKRLVHRVVSLDDVKLVKNAMNVVVFDPNENEKEKEREAKKRNNLPKRIRLRALLAVNVRPSAGIEALAEMMKKRAKIRWGNKFGYVIIPLNIASQDDPLNYIHQAKASVDRKKHSFEALCSFLLNKLLAKLIGDKATVALAHKLVFNTTLSFSNVAGPLEEINLFGHPITYIAPTGYGLPHALMIHWASCANKMTFVLSVDQDVIPDPHQLCNDIMESLQLIKDTCVKLKSTSVENIV